MLLLVPLRSYNRTVRGVQYRPVAPRIHVFGQVPRQMVATFLGKLVNCKAVYAIYVEYAKYRPGQLQMFTDD